MSSNRGCDTEALIEALNSAEYWHGAREIYENFKNCSFEFDLEQVLLSFDYGLYSNSLHKLDSYREYFEQTEVIHGHKAKIVTYTKSNTEFVIAIHFPQGGRQYKSGNALTIISICRSKQDYDVVQKIYSSIKFLE